ncbi:MAG: 30S ribosomal protein S17 [Candidatus Spechtbacterales bacterium]
MKKDTKNKKSENIETSKRKRLHGKVASNKMNKTLVVRVDRLIEHPKYKKRYTISKRYKAHYEEGEYELGDKVEIEEHRPISKDKKWKVVKKI